MKHGAYIYREDQGAILLEVVLALMLFVGAAAVIGTAMRTSDNALEKTRLQLHAANLAISTLAEMQMGSLAVAEMEAHPFEPPFEQWTREIHVQQNQSGSQNPSQLKRVEVIVRHGGENIVHRLHQWVLPPMQSEASSAGPDVSPAPTP